MRRAIAAGAVVVTIVAAACSKSDNTTPTTTPTPTVTNTVQTFTGTVDVRGSVYHAFTVGQAGEVAVTLTSTTPAGVAMQLSVGVPSDVGCSPLAGATVTAASAESPQLIGRMSAATMCVLVADAGRQTAPVGYSVNVSHP